MAQKCFWWLNPFDSVKKCGDISRCDLFRFAVYTDKSSKPPNDMKLENSVVTDMSEKVSDPINHTVLFDCPINLCMLLL